MKKEEKQLIKELFELHYLLAEKGEIIAGYGFSEMYKSLKNRVEKIINPNNEELFYCYKEEVKAYRCYDCCSVKGKCLFINNIQS
jgi:hypothetical protein